VYGLEGCWRPRLETRGRDRARLQAWDCVCGDARRGVPRRGCGGGASGICACLSPHSPSGRRQAMRWPRLTSAGVMGSGSASLGIPPRPSRVREAANQGLCSAQANLAYMYLNGEGVRKDGKLAEEWYAKAAARGSDRAHTRSATCTSPARRGEARAHRREMVPHGGKQGHVPRNGR